MLPVTARGAMQRGSEQMTSERGVPTLAAIEERMHAWRLAHPQATLTEIEAELDRQLHAARAQLLAAVAGQTATVANACPDCGERLVQRGRHARTLVSTGDEPVCLTRAYTRCPRCGNGLFPPG
jgi:predicted RNA-binding Zn-ribbon protein involved in translation (DUF1610 family)